MEVKRPEYILVLLGVFTQKIYLLIHYYSKETYPDVKDFIYTKHAPIRPDSHSKFQITKFFWPYQNGSFSQSLNALLDISTNLLRVIQRHKFLSLMTDVRWIERNLP